MKDLKLVSVLIPTYNVEEYVEKAVESILNQTYENLEIIIVDDCSTDGTYKILEGLSKKDSRIKLFSNSKNSKIAYTLNRAWEQSSGEYLARMDGDDISLPDRIERKIKFLQDNTEYDLVGSSIQSIDEFGNIIGSSKFSSNHKVLKKTLKYSSPVAHIWLAKRKVYEKLNGYREISGCEDYDFLLRMDTEGFKFTNLENYFGYQVRIHNKNTNSRMGLKQRKMHQYVYSLYTERLETGTDSFTPKKLEDSINSTAYSIKLYHFSSKMLAKSIRAKGKSRYLKYAFYLILSLISPMQIKYLGHRFLYKMVVYFNKIDAE